MGAVLFLSYKAGRILSKLSPPRPRPTQVGPPEVMGPLTFSVGPFPLSRQLRGRVGIWVHPSS